MRRLKFIVGRWPKSELLNLRRGMNLTTTNRDLWLRGCYGSRGRKFWYRVVRLVCVAVFVLLTFAVARAEPKRLLIINSFGSNVRPWSEYSKGIRDELRKQWTEPLNIYETSLETARFDVGNSEALFADYLQALLANRDLDLLVSIGVPAEDFVLPFRRKVLPSTPTLLTSVEERRVQYAGLTDNDAVVALKVDFARVAETILQVLPETTNVVVVIGNSPLEQYWMGEMRNAFQPFADRIKFTYFNQLSFDEMRTKVAALPPRSAIYFHLLSADEQFEALRKLHAIANAPIFSYIDIYFGEGIIGGPLITVQEQSQVTASAIVRILRGEEPAKVKTPAIEFGVPKFDWRELRRWGISEVRLPPGSKIYFRDPTAWDQYLREIIATVALIGLQTAMIMWLLYEQRRRRYAETTALQRANELARLNRVATAGQLSASIAHEIRQPLTAIAANCGTALAWIEHNVPNLEKARAALQRAMSGTRRAEDVIKGMRAMFGKESTERKTVDLNDLVSQVLALTAHTINANKIVLQTSLADDQPPLVMVDAIQLQQVILNLIMNAVEAMGSSDQLVKRLRIATGIDPDGNVVLTVEDSGPGIDPKVAGRLFEPFVTTKSGGMGMGLSICRSIIEAHDGRLTAGPAGQRGTRFEVVLPLVRQGRRAR